MIDGLSKVSSNQAEIITGMLAARSQGFLTCLPRLFARLESKLDWGIERARDQRRHLLQAQPANIFSVDLEQSVAFGDHARAVRWAALVNAFHKNFEEAIRIGLGADRILFLGEQYPDLKKESQMTICLDP